MNHFPQPPITQWRTEDRGSGRVIEPYRNDPPTSAIANAKIRVLGRRRLNDYVGSPIWSEWEELDDQQHGASRPLPTFAQLNGTGGGPVWHPDEHGR